MSVSQPQNVISRSSPVHQIQQKAFSKVDWNSVGLPVKVMAVFDSFIETFRERHWRYTAGGIRMSSRLILTGEQTLADLERHFELAAGSAGFDCGSICDLLSLTLIILVDGLHPAQVSIPGIFVTKKLGTPPPGVQGSFTCIDLQVQGNVRSNNTTYQQESRCLFDDHFALQIPETALTYDACLCSVYQDINVVVDTLLKSPDPNTRIARNPPPPGGRKPLQFQLLNHEHPTGFGRGFLRVT